MGEKGQHQPSGLYDMHGNVWEWCEDVWDANAYRKRLDGWTARAWSEEDAGEDAEGEEENRDRVLRDRVLRGGSWGVTAGDCRSACRGRGRPGNRDGGLGFRLCVFPGSGEPGAGGQTGNGVLHRSQGKEGRRSHGSGADGAEWDGTTLPAA